MIASDEDLVLACRRSDAAAWEELVRRYQRLIYAIPRRAGLGDDLATEVLQGTFLRLVEHLGRLEQPSRVGAWLVTTARRETWRVSREARASTPLVAPGSDDEAEIDLPDPAELPDETVMRLERQHQVRLALTALDGRCQDLLRMLFYAPEPPPYAEVAAALGISVGSIGPIRARCLQKLRSIMEDRQI